MKYLMICFAMLIGLSSCSKEDIESKLPPETTTGKNTAGFIVDGKTVVLPSNSVSSVPGSGTSHGLTYKKGRRFDSLERDYLSVQVSNSNSNDIYSTYVRIDKLYEEAPKTYILGNSNGEYGMDGPNYPQIILIHSSKDKDTQWYYSRQNSGSITMTNADFVSRTFSGTFEGTLYNRFDEAKTIKITQGRFDINLRTLNK